MTEKRRTIILSVLVCLLIVTLMTFSLTRARYSGEHESESEYGSDIEYTVSNQVEVSTADEFFTAIENGYSNIQVSDDADSTIIITGGVSDVNSDLTIDLNGHELQRNNRDPMLNVTEGVRLTIVDSKGGGGFYNPVGSVLRISGGTLTVAAGLFESGPRDGDSMSAQSGDAVHPSEYASGRGESWSTENAGSFTGTTSGELYERSGTSYTRSSVSGLPVIIPADAESKSAINGNMYFDEGTGISLASGRITEDTYLYFAVESANVQNSTVSAGSADFYYSYTLYEQTDADGIVTGYSPSGNSGGEEVTVTVYGYNTVKGTSEAAGNTFAAIQMNSGDLYARGGEYVSYFGNDSTYCVYASGGYMSVSSGTVFEAHEYGICVNIAYAETRSEDEYLGVRGGDFYSAAGDTIRVSGGEMYVRGGTFTKNASAYASAQTVGDNGSAIAISGGTLDVEGTEDARIAFSMQGSYMNGISSTAGTSSEGTVTVTNADFTFAGDGENNYGINSDAGTVTANGCVFTLPGEYSRGISVARGTVSVGGAGGEAIENAPDTNTYSYFYLDSAVGCYGVYAQTNGNENATVKMAAAQVFVGQRNGVSSGTASYSALNGAGIYMNAAGSSSVELGNVLVIAAGNSVSGVYVKSGSITQDADGKLVVVTGAQASRYSAGSSQFRDIQSYGTDASGKITDLLGNGRVKRSETAYGYGVYSGGGKIDLQNVFAAVYGQYSAGILAASTDTSDAVTIGGALDIVVSQGNEADRVTGRGSTLSSTAISTEGGPVTIGGNANIVSDGLGITARKGNVIFGSAAASSLQVNTARGTAVYVEGGTLTLNSGVTVDITSAIDDGWNWVDPPGTTAATVINKYNGVYVNGGSLTANGTFNVTHTGVANDEQEGATYATFKIKSYAVRVEQGNSDTNVLLLKGNIESILGQDKGGGGGLYVGGGTVTLGEENSANEDLTITSNGNTVFGGNHIYFGDGIGDHRNWAYKLPRTGGHAVQVGESGSTSSASLTIYAGTFEAKMGNGILVGNGVVNIHEGIFIGADVYGTNEGNGMQYTMPGAAASYGFKLYGGTVNIYGGTFGDPNATGLAAGSGAFVMGTASRATANIYSGEFTVNGTAGVAVYQNVDVYFGGDQGGANTSYTAPELKGNAAAITVEKYPSSVASSIITIYSGTYEGNKDGIWYGEGATRLNISGGTFSALSERAALEIEETPSIQISKGTFSTEMSNTNAINATVSVTYGDVLAAGARAQVSYRDSTTQTYYSNSNTPVNETVEGSWWTTYHASKVTVE